MPPHTSVPTGIRDAGMPGGNAGKLGEMQANWRKTQSINFVHKILVC